jgi:carboxyl-terminal processing protease
MENPSILCNGSFPIHSESKIQEAPDMKQEWRRHIVRVVLGALIFSFFILGTGAGPDSVALQEPYPQLKILNNVIFLIQNNYVEKVDLKELIQGAIKGTLQTLDPHSSYLTPEQYSDMKVDTRGSFEGVGIEITVKDYQLTVVAPIEGTPAEKAGILPGDRIIKIDGQVTKDMTLHDAVSKMRGPRGSQVTLTILRGESQTPQDFILVREMIRVKSVRTKDLEEGIGYIRIASFQEKTSEDLQKALGERYEKGLKGIILDLRSNPGGLLDQAIQVSDQFLEKGKLVVYTQGRTEEKHEYFARSGQRKNIRFPMVVMINGGSASASEIVAGALQDWKRAVVLGTPSFGKASVQTIIELEDHSALRLTTARYFTPLGKAIQGKGISPDIVVEVPKVEAGEKPSRPKEAEQKGTEPKISEDEGVGLEEMSRKEADVVKDFQLQRALEILKAHRML